MSGSLMTVDEVAKYLKVEESTIIRAFIFFSWGERI